MTRQRGVAWSLSSLMARRSHALGGIPDNCVTLYGSGVMRRYPFHAL
jgi:hypothetical protein